MRRRIRFSLPPGRRLSRSTGQPALPFPRPAAARCPAFPIQTPAMTSPRRGFRAAARLVHGFARPQTSVCAGCLAIALPAAVEGYAGHASTDLQESGYRPKAPGSVSGRVRFRAGGVAVSGGCVPHHLSLAPALDAPVSGGFQAVVSAAQGVQVLRERRAACFGPVVVERCDVVQVAACGGHRAAGEGAVPIPQPDQPLHARGGLVVENLSTRVPRNRHPPSAKLSRDSQRTRASVVEQSRERDSPLYSGRVAEMSSRGFIGEEREGVRR